MKKEVEDTHKADEHIEKQLAEKAIEEEVGEERKRSFLAKNLTKVTDYVLSFLKGKRQRLPASLSYSAVLTELTRLNDKLEETPHLNFLSLLNSYKRVIDVLDGSVGYFYRKRNTLWFKEFFPEQELYELVKEDLKRYNKKYSKIKLTITKNGILIYYNYKKNRFNTLLMTIHGGKWVPNYGKDLMHISERRRLQEDDLGTDIIYGPFVLENGGVWINAKFSRFFCDLNRRRPRAIYSNTSEPMVGKIWKKELTSPQKATILKNYDQFYYVLEKLVDTHRFNIIFDGHTMRQKPGRPPFSFGVKCIPHFYYPIVEHMRTTLRKETGQPVDINNPYGGGHILKHLAEQYPDVFIFSMEVNKKLYMDRTHLKVSQRKVNKLCKAIDKMLTFERPKHYGKRCPLERD